MLSDRELSQKWCNAFEHHWREVYYGYECEICGEFIPYGCEPWLDDEDEEYRSNEYYNDEPDYPF